jgi:hypothetical protein
MGCDKVSAAGREVPWRWTDPTVIEQKTFRKESDVWSFGVTLWEILARVRPYDEIEEAPDVLSFVQGGGRLLKPSRNSGVRMSTELRDKLYSNVLLKCWDRDLGSRPSMSDIAGEFSTMLKQHTASFDSENTYSPEEITASTARFRSSTASSPGEAYGTMYDRIGRGTTRAYGSLIKNTKNEPESSSDKNSPDKSPGGQYSTMVSTKDGRLKGAAAKAAPGKKGSSEDAKEEEDREEDDSKEIELESESSSSSSSSTPDDESSTPSSTPDEENSTSDSLGSQGGGLDGSEEG